MPCFAIRVVFIQVNDLFDRRTNGCAVRRETDRWSLQTDGLFVLERKYLLINNPDLISMKPLSIFLWPNLSQNADHHFLVVPGISVLFWEHCGPGQMGIWIPVEMCKLALMLNNCILGLTEVLTEVLKNKFLLKVHLLLIVRSSFM